MAEDTRATIEPVVETIDGQKCIRQERRAAVHTAASVAKAIGRTRQRETVELPAELARVRALDPAELLAETEARITRQIAMQEKIRAKYEALDAMLR